MRGWVIELVRYDVKMGGIGRMGELMLRGLGYEVKGGCEDINDKEIKVKLVGVERF